MIYRKPEILKEIITHYNPNIEKLKEFSAQTDFIKDLEINSADLVDIILDIEDKFSITIDDEGMQNIMSVQAALDVIDQELAKK